MNTENSILTMNVRCTRLKFIWRNKPTIQQQSMLKSSVNGVGNDFAKKGNFKNGREYIVIYDPQPGKKSTEAAVQRCS